MTFGIWSDRKLRPEHARLLDGAAAIVEDMAEAEGILASGALRCDHALMDRAPRLRVISRTGIGLDNVALEEATARRIAVCNLPEGPTVSTAEHALALLLATAKRLREAERAVRETRPEYANEHDAIELAGLTLGLVGLGRIGSRMARYAQALGMHVLAYDPYAADVPGVERTATLAELLTVSDVVSLHAPLTSETRGLLDAPAIERMKPGAILVNAARGGLVDERALLDALDRGHLAGAGLDVFDPEPPDPGNPLLSHDRVVATPHVASSTAACRDRLWRGAIAQALQVLRGERPPHLVNAEVWDTP
jgi:D-3-phosphoglycerate dehydrogenase / 2-oxoglutarate reductase